MGLSAKPPNPEPEELIPIAVPRRVVNHWGMVDMIDMYVKEDPMPKSTPCVK